MYDIKTAADIQEALKDLLGGTIQSMLETELEEQMEDREEEDPEYHDSRNGYKPKALKSSVGRNPHPGTAGPEQRLRAAGGAEVQEGHQRNRGKDHRDVRTRDERSTGFGANQGHLRVRGQRRDGHGDYEQAAAGGRGVAEVAAERGISHRIH